MKKICLSLCLLFAFSASAQRFQENAGLIYIEDGSGNAFQCPNTEFTIYEESYELAPSGYVRIWTDASKSLRKDGNTYSDPFYLGTPALYAYYTDTAQIAIYQAAYDEHHTPTPTPTPVELPALWVDLTITPQDEYFTGLSGLLAFPNSSAGAFEISAEVYLDEEKTIPLNQLDGVGFIYIIGNIVPRTGQILSTIRLLKSFTNNACTFVLSPETLLSGRYSLNEDDFNNITISEQEYQFKLIAPNSPEGRAAIEFDIYDASL